MTSTTLPIGIDLGRRRVRAALCELGAGGKPDLIAVAARDHDGEGSAALADALDELHTRERRCVVALGVPDALLREIAFPPMPRWERARAARFEAERFVDYPIADATVSLVPSASGGWTLGIARRAALDNALAIVRRMRLRALAVDDVAFAVRRAHAAATCIVDVGSATTRVIRYTPGLPAVSEIPAGGDRLTEAIARALAIDIHAAEDRKRQVGLGGAGDAERDRIVSGIAAALRSADSGIPVPASIVLCGNGARVPGFAAALATATGCAVTLAELPPDASCSLPADVLRAAGADWSVAYGLSLWSVAG